MSTNPSLYRLPTSTRARRQGLLLLTAAALVGIVLAGLAVAASRLAHLTNYPEELGVPLLPALPSRLRRVLVTLAAGTFVFVAFRRRWKHLAAAAVWVLAAAFTAYPLYPPSTYLLARRALAGSRYASLLGDAEAWGLAASCAVAAAGLPHLRGVLAALIRTGHLHGSARLATSEDILKSGFVIDDTSSRLSQSSALPLGSVELRGGRRLLRAAGDVHTLLFAPPGAGKTTAYVIPTAMDWQGNLIVLDVKGEISQATAGFRQQQGSRILLLDPSRDHHTLARYNPLLSVRLHPFDVQDVAELAQLLVPDAQGADPFWRQSARTILEGVILHVLYAESEKTLAGCYRYLCSADQPMESQFERMLATLHDPSACFGWTRHPRVETAARTYLDMPATTRGGVIAQALASLSPYADPILATASSVSDFALEDLYSSTNRPVTLYIVMNPNSLQRLADHIRIVISQITAALTRELPTPGRQPVLLLLDEFPVFGRMKVFETAIAYLRGYGVQCYVVVQHLGQLTAAYGKSESISPNCPVHVAFAPADLETAQALSKRAGNQTIRFERGSVSSQGLRSNVSVQEADSARPLFTPDEIMRLPKGQALVFRTGSFPIHVVTEPYFKDAARVAASKLPCPASEPTRPDLSPWLSRVATLPPPPARRETRLKHVANLLHEEKSR